MSNHLPRSHDGMINRRSKASHLDVAGGGGGRRCCCPFKWCGGWLA